MTDTTLVSKAVELPASTGAHMQRLASLLVVLERVSDHQLPDVRDWESRASDYRLPGSLPSVRGTLTHLYELDEARAAVGQWADALGTVVKEQYLEKSYRRVEITAEAEVDGVCLVVGVAISAYGECPGCGGPAVGKTVLRHYTDAPCTGALALQA